MADAPLTLGPFVIGEKLGQGGFGSVYAATHAQLGTPVAVKVVDDPRWSAALTHEVAAIARLDHPNVVRIFDWGFLEDARLGAPGSPYLAMERCSGGSLRDRVRGITSWDAARRVLLAVLDALAHAHAAGVLHRDVKLANVLFCTEDDLRPGVRVVDFGLALLGQDAPDGGTPLYMPPEQFDSTGPDQGPWSDLYALGVVAWRLVSTTPPWQARNKLPLLTEKVGGPLLPPTLRFPVPEGAFDWLVTLLRPAWSQRYASAAAAAQALRALGSADDGAAGSVDTSEAPTELATGVTELLAVDLPDQDVSSGPAAPRATLPGQPSAPIDWVQDAALAATGLELLGVRDPALTGRDPTLAWLWRQAVEARKAPTATTLALVGPEGSGRRRCARWLARQLHVDGGGLHTVVDGEVPEPPALLASVLGCATDALRTRLHGLHALSAQVGARLDLLLDPTTPREVGLGLALGILGAVARQVPVTVVLVDVDLHPGRLRLASRDVAGPVLFVVTAVDPPPHTPSHALPPLSPETLHRLLGSWAPLHWRTASAAVEASAGCPGRLVRWVRGQALTLDADGRLVPAKDVPDTVARVLEAHDAEATVLGLLGPAVPRGAPAAVLERLGIDLGGVLVQAERAAHLEASPAGWAFRTAGLADAYARAERGLDPTVLRACADILDAAGCADRAVDLALLAGDLDRAVDLFTNRLSWSRTVEQIEDFARRLTSLWDGPPTEALHGQVRLLLARNAVSQVHPDAPRHLADLEALAAEQGWTLTAAQCVKLRHVRGDASIDEVVDAFDAAPSGALRDAFLVQNLIEQSSPDRLPGALDLARELGSRQLEEGVLSAMAHVAGDVRTAALHARERANHIETSSRAYVLVFAQHLLVEGADYTGGLAVGREAIAWCRLVEQPQALLVGLVNQAICHARLDDWESAARTAGYALALPRQPVLTELCRIVIAIDAARAGRPWPARELLPVVAAMRPTIERLGGQARWLLEGLETAAQRKSETR